MLQWADVCPHMNLVSLRCSVPAWVLCGRVLWMHCARVLWSQDRPTALLAWRDDRSIDTAGHPSDRFYSSLPPWSSPFSAAHRSKAVTCRLWVWHVTSKDCVGMTCSPIGCRCWNAWQSIIKQVTARKMYWFSGKLYLLSPSCSDRQFAIAGQWCDRGLTWILIIVVVVRPIYKRGLRDYSHIWRSFLRCQHSVWCEIYSLFCVPIIITAFLADRTACGIIGYSAHWHHYVACPSVTLC